MAEDEIKSRFDLDTKESLQKLVEVREAIIGLGESKNLASLIGGLAKANAGIIAVGASLYAVHKSMDLVFEAEKIKAINTQFEILGRNAGVATEVLRAGLESASRGLIDDTDLIETANRALVTMGEGAAKLPQILDLARKSASLFGKDTNEQFQELVQAIESGNQRSLRRLGIMIDVRKAEEDYARSLGVSVNALSDHGRQQAILNAVLEQGGKSFAGVDENVKASTNSWQQLKVTLGSISEAFTLIFERTVGPAVNKFLTILNESARGVKALFGVKEEGGATQKKLEELTSILSNAQAQAEHLKKSLDENFSESGKAALDRLNATIQQTEREINALNRASEGKVSKKSGVDLSAQLADDAKYYSDKNRLLQESLELERQTYAADNEQEDQLRAIRDQMDLALLDQHEQTIAAIKQQYRTRDTEMKSLLEIENENFEMRKVALAQQTEDQIQALRLASLDNQINMSDDAFTKIALGAQRASLKSGQEFLRFEKVGNAAVSGIANGFTQAFSHVADGNFDLARDMKKAIIGALADEAQARGALLIASSVWPPNPLALAGGLGLVSLSGVLRSLAGGGGGSAIPTASGAAGAGQGFSPTAPGGFGTATVNSDVLRSSEEEKARKQVSIVIQGNYFDTDQTRQRLVEIIRDSADYSDFKVQSVGGGL